MKTLINLLIPVFILGFIVSGFTDKAATTQSILIQSSGKNISSELLSQSAKIATDRLNDFKIEDFSITMIPEKSQIRVTLNSSFDIESVENLLTQKGTIGFYETFDHNGLARLLNGDNTLFSLLTGSKTDNSGAKIGCTSIGAVEKVNDYLKILGLDQKCKFAWTRNFAGSDICLYALKNNGEKGAIITGTDIESARYDQERIQIKLKPSAYGLWSDATRRNINSVIAIVVDDNVISAPLVRSAIDSGAIEITGSFTAKEGNYLAAIMNNGELPVSFFIIK